MKIHMITFLASFAIATAAFLPSASAVTEKRPPTIPLEDFFRLPQKAQYRISPDGRHYAFLQPWKDRLNIYVQPIDFSEEPVRVTSSEARDITAYAWMNNSRLVYFQDRGGDENYRAYAVDLDGGNPLDLTPFEGVKTMMVDDLEKEPDYVLISMNKRDRRLFDVYRVNVYTGKMTMAAENPGNVAGWGTDHDGKIRIAYAMEGTKTSILYRADENSPFKTLVTTDFRDHVIPVGFTADNRHLYMASNLGRDRVGLYEYDPESMKDVRTIYENSEVDVSGILWSEKRGKLLGITYYTDRRHIHFLDEEERVLYEMLEKKFPGYDTGISSTSRDETKMIVYITGDRSRGKLYYCDRKAPEDLRLLANISPWLQEDDLAEMRPISYRARDGLIIHGYLTLPKGAKPENLPVVINPHGGPEARDYWGYNPEVQFLANRGMAVLQMNFRISTGYGKTFWKAGFRQWGRKQQDDITDGVRWLIDRGIADPKRIAIYGASYGGYATLMGLIRTPELYACGVDYVGVTNLFTLFESFPPYWELVREQSYVTIGHPEKDKELFREISPVFLADRIRAPLLIAQGANDPRVVKAESDQMVEALQKRGVEVPYMVKENEGHGFRNQENRFDFYRAMEKFLTEHLKLKK